MSDHKQPVHTLLGIKDLEWTAVFLSLLFWPISDMADKIVFF
jgi:hypothetical protein